MTRYLKFLTCRSEETAEDVSAVFDDGIREGNVYFDADDIAYVHQI